MTKRTRTILFFLLLILFLLVTPTLLLYSQGYRFDFEKKRISQTGAFYFKVSPKSAEVYLNGQLKKKTDFFFGGVFLDNLLPKKYAVEIKKDGYFPWKKTLVIKEKEVTEAKNIILFPEKFKFNFLTKKVEDFFFSPDGKKIILKTKDQKPNQKIVWALKIFDLEKNLQSHLIEEEEILNFIGNKKNSKISLLDLKFSIDSRKILIKLEIKEKKISKFKYFIIDIQNESPSLISLDFLGEGIENVSFHPKDPQKLFFTKLIKEKTSSKTSLFETDYLQKKVSQTNFNDLLSYTLSNRDIFWFSQDGYLLKNEEKINLKPLVPKKESQLEIYLNESAIFLKENGLIYLLDQDSKIFRKIQEKIKDLKFSPDGKKIVYFSNNELWVLFLEKILQQPQKKKGENLLIARLSKDINQVFWLNSHYLIFNTQDKIKITEIDDRDIINIVDLNEFKNSKIFFNKNDKKLYILSDSNLFSSQKLF